MRLTFMTAGVAVLFFSVAARADSYQYTFVGSFDTTIGDTYDTFRYESSTLLKGNTSFIAACGVASSCEVNYEVSFREIRIVEPSGIEDQHSDLSPSFFTLGTHTDQGDTLTINDVNAVTPEPSSLALLGTGVLSVIGVARRRLIRA